MAIDLMMIISPPIGIGRHQTYCIETVLLTKDFAQLDTGDLGNGIPLIRGLKSAGEQRLLLDKLLEGLRMDAAAAQKQQPPHPISRSFRSNS